MFSPLLSKFSFLILCVISCVNVTAAKDANTVISGMNHLRRSVDATHDVFKTYDGGVMPSLALGRAVWDVYSRTRETRNSWDMAPAFEESQVPDILASYHSLRLSIADALETARSKVFFMLHLLFWLACLVRFAPVNQALMGQGLCVR